MNLLQTKQGYHLCRELDFGDRFSMDTPFYPYYKQYSYEIDEECRDIFANIAALVDLENVSFVDSMVASKLVEANSQLAQNHELVMNLICLQRSILKYGLNVSSSFDRLKFCSENRDANFSEFMKANVAMCTEFSVLGYFVLRHLGIKSSLVTSYATFGSPFNISETHTLLYLDEFNVFWDVCNYIESGPNLLPMFYTNSNSEFGLDSDLYTFEGGECDLVANPEHKSPKFRFDLNLSTKFAL